MTLLRASVLRRGSQAGDEREPVRLSAKKSETIGWIEHPFRREAQYFALHLGQNTDHRQRLLEGPSNLPVQSLRMSLEAGRKLGPYEIVAPIGKGGMGEVYRARDTKLGRDVAIKVLPEEFANDDERLSRFEREARATAALNHPGIVTLYGIEAIDGIHFLTMELVSGRTLAEIVADGALTAESWFRLASELTDALAAAHARGIAHRDLKPANIIVTIEERPKILDFGLAKPARSDFGDEDSTRHAVTQQGQLLGTVPYMSPEQARGENVGIRSDIFSIGTVLYEMATGFRPFSGRTPSDLIASILRDTPPAAGLGAADDVLRRCFEKDANDRYSNSAELRDAIESARAQQHSRTEADDQIRSIAVLPLANSSGDASQDFFADGMTDAVINELAKIGELKVISRTSMMQFKGSKAPLPEIARILDVQAIVEGSVLRDGGEVRVSVQLIRADTDQNLWADSYEREMESVIRLQREIASAIAGSVNIVLSPELNASFETTPRIDPAAYELVLKGSFFLHTLTRADLRTARECFDKALELDSSSALAYVRLGMLELFEGLIHMQPMDVALQSATLVLERAIELDDSIAEAHSVMGGTRISLWKWAHAERSLQRALQLNPNSATTWNIFGAMRWPQRRYREAIEAWQKAVALDPLSPVYAADLAMVYFLDGQTDRSLRQLSSSLERHPDSWMLHTYYSWILGVNERFEEALEHAEEARRKDEEIKTPKAIMASVLAMSGRDRRARDLVEEVVASAPPEELPGAMLAEAYARLGEVDIACDWLELAA